MHDPATRGLEHTTDPQHPLSTVLHFAANVPFGMEAEREGSVVSDWPFKLEKNFRLPVHAGKKV